MKLTITLVLKTEETEKALRVISKLNQIIQADAPELEKYHKGGIKAVLSKDLHEVLWPNACISTMSTAQLFGRSWTLIGNIEEEISLVSEMFSVPGIEWAELSLIRQ